MWVVGIINMALLMLNFSVIKIITGIEYLKIFFGSVIQEFVYNDSSWNAISFDLWIL